MGAITGFELNCYERTYNPCTTQQPWSAGHRVQPRCPADNHVFGRFLRLGPGCRSRRALHRITENPRRRLQDYGGGGFGVRYRPGVSFTETIVAEGPTRGRGADFLYAERPVG